MTLSPSSHRHKALVVTLLAFVMLRGSVFGQSDTTMTPVEQLRKDATAMQPLVKSEVAKQLIEAYTSLPSIPEPRIVYFNRAKRDAISEADYIAQGLDTTSGYLRRELGEQFYYFTMYGTPVAFARALDLVGQAGLKSLNQARVCEFGFGSIGQLRAMASLGADVAGIEVEPLLKVFYGQPGDTGVVSAFGKNDPGHVDLHFGFFPTDEAITKSLGTGFDLFVSKNTLKRGYVHPEKEVDPKMLVHLGVDDSTFIKRVYDMLKPGGFFMIYNLHPKYTPPTAEKYIPWSDGRSPFEKALCEQIGFKVIAFDLNDTEFAHQMAKAFGWDASMDLPNDLFGMYTLLQKK